MNEDQYIVDIPMCAYNHESFIAQAIEGVINQVTSFKYRLIIGEDCSKDNTRLIVKHYLDRNPEKMQVFFHDKNIGAHENSKILFASCSSKYIALCDGDDYWTDPYKLQKQVDFLEANEDYAICFHPAYQFREDGFNDISNKNIIGKQITFTINDLSLGNFLHTPTVVFRNGLIANFPDWFFESPVGDYPLYMLLATHGKIHYTSEPMAVYRIHNSSLWSTISEVAKWEKWITVLNLLIPHFDGEVQGKLKLQEFNNYIHIANLHKLQGNTEKYIHFLATALGLDISRTKNWLNENYITSQVVITTHPGGIWATAKNLYRQIAAKIKSILN